MTGITTDGGYAEVMIAEARALALIPDELKSGDAAPLVCAGITTFTRTANAGRAGDTVAVQGIGGLGHLAVQFARRMGFPYRGDWWRPRQGASRAETRSACLH